MVTAVLGVTPRQKTVQRKKDYLSGGFLCARKSFPDIFPQYTSLILVGHNRVSGLFKPIIDKRNDWVINRIYLWADNYITFLMCGCLNQFMVLLARMLAMSTGEPTNYICCMWFSNCDPWNSSITSLGNTLKFKFFCFTSDLLNRELCGPSHLCFNGLCRWFWYRIKFKNYSVTIKFTEEQIYYLLRAMALHNSREHIWNAKKEVTPN